MNRASIVTAALAYASLGTGHALATEISITNPGFESVSRALAPGEQSNGIGGAGVLVGTRVPFPFGPGLVDWSDPVEISGWRTRLVETGSPDQILAGVLRPGDVGGTPFVTGIEGDNVLAIQAAIAGQATDEVLQPDTTYTLSFLAGISPFDSEYFFGVTLTAIDDAVTLPLEGQPGVTRLQAGSFFPPSPQPDGILRRYEFSYTTPETLPSHLAGRRLGINIFGSDGIPRVVYDDFRLDAKPNAPDCPADVNNDGVASPADFTAWLACFNDPMSAPYCDRADVNASGSVDPADFTAWLAAFSAGCGWSIAYALFDER